MYEDQWGNNQKEEELNEITGNQAIIHRSDMAVLQAS